MIKQLLNSVIAKYRDLLVSCRSIICLSLRLRQMIIDLLATDKSRYFGQSRPIIVYYLDDIDNSENNDNNDDFNIPYGVFIDSKPVIQGMLAHSPVKLITTGEVKNSTVVLVVRN